MALYEFTWKAFGTAVIDTDELDGASPADMAADAIYQLDDIDLESIEINGVDISDGEAIG
jgi:hypothetical protein